MTARGTAQPASTIARDDAIMLGAFGTIAYVASMAAHEALGHGLYCILLGGHSVMLTAWGERCSVYKFGIEAAGPLVQFASGLASWLALQLLPRAPANLRFALLLSMTYDLLVSSGYVVLSGVTGFGDAGVLIQNLAPVFLWRAGLAAGGGAVYYLSMRAAAFELKRFAGSDNSAARLARLVWIPYFAAGVIACCGAALNTSMPPIIALQLAAASAFGGAFGLVCLPGLQRNMKTSTSPAPAAYVGRSLGWAAAATLTIIFFFMVLAPGWAAR